MKPTIGNMVRTALLDDLKAAQASPAVAFTLEDIGAEFCNDAFCNIIAWIIETVGVDAVLARVPDKWTRSEVDEGEASKKTIAWWWLWEQLISSN